jgi:hypothetical protein
VAPSGAQQRCKQQFVLPAKSSMGLIDTNYRSLSRSMAQKQAAFK